MKTRSIISQIFLKISISLVEKIYNKSSSIMITYVMGSVGSLILATSGLYTGMATS